MKKYRLLDLGIFTFYLNAFLQGVLVILGAFEFKDMLFVTHILLFVWALISAVLLIREYRKHKQREIHLLLIAYIIVGASGIIALILYWLFEISYYGSIFELGNLVFLVLVIADAVMMMADNVRYRLESQAYERLSREDGMTGLETRANFEKKLESISADMGRYRDYPSYVYRYRSASRDQRRIRTGCRRRDGGDLGQMCGERFTRKKEPATASAGMNLRFWSMIRKYRTNSGRNA